MPASWPRPDGVPRYYLHLRYGEGADGLAVDPEGDEVPGDGMLREHVAGTVRDLMRGPHLEAIPNWQGCVFEVADEEGRPVLTLAFRDVAAAQMAKHWN